MLVSALVLQMLLVIGGAAGNARADEAFCSPNSSDIGIPSDSALGSVLPNLKRCINGVKFSSRGWLTPSSVCVKGPRPVGYVYNRAHGAECGGTSRDFVGAEAIAQSRAIAWESQLNYGVSGVGVAPDVQWEVVLPSRQRPDILVYDHNSTGPYAPVDVTEVKGDWNNDWPGRAAQVQGYVTQLQALGMTNARLGTTYEYYTDTFEVYLGTCSDGSEVRRPYTVTPQIPPVAGLLEIHKGQENSCSDNQPPVRLAQAQEDDVNEDADRPQTHHIPTLPGPPGVPGGGKPKGTAHQDKAATVSGDPHITTVDGLNYELQAAGEFDLAVSRGLGVDVQARFEPSGSNVSVITAIATSVNGALVELRADGTVLLNGEARTIADGDGFGLGGGILERQGADYFITFPVQGDSPPVISFEPRGDTAAVGVYYPAGASELSGLVGNADGNPNNDLRLRDGTQLPVNASPATLHGTFADSWRISDDYSDFTYAAGASTATYTNQAFPSQIITSADFTQTQRAAATSTCLQSQVPPGPQFDDCVLDVLVTGDSSLAQLAAEITRPSITPSDLTLNAGGHALVDFEGTVPQNFVALRNGTDAGLSTYSGPFTSGEQYQFYVPTMPSHDQLTIGFDVIAIGDWAASPAAENVHFSIGGWSSTQPGAWTQVGSGTLTTGQPYTVYHASVTAADTSVMLGAAFSADGVSATDHEAYAIDNVSVDAHLVPAQTFNVALPVTISHDQPSAGAGDIETVASRDVYALTISQGGQGLYLDWQACLPGNYGRWQVLDSGGNTVAGGYCSSGRAPDRRTGPGQLHARDQLRTRSSRRLRAEPLRGQQAADLRR